MTPERLAEIREADPKFDLIPNPNGVYAHRRELLAYVDELHQQLAEREDKAVDRMADQLLSETRLRNLEIRGGNFNMELTEAQEMAAAYVAMCRTMLGDAENYTETPIGFPKAKTELEVKIAESPDDWYVLTVQRKWKLSPHEARQRAETERDQARQIARAYRSNAADGFGNPRAFFEQAEPNLLGHHGLAALPDWLTENGETR